MIVFGSSGPLDVGSLGPQSPHVHSSVKTLAVHFDIAFRFDYIADVIYSPVKFLSAGANP